MSMKMSSSTAVSWSSARALAVIFMRVIRMGMTNGKLKMAIRVALLLVLAEMAEMNVKVIENPRLPRKIAVRNKL